MNINGKVPGWVHKLGHVVGGWLISFGISREHMPSSIAWRIGEIELIKMSGKAKIASHK